MSFHYRRALLAILIPVLFGFGPCGPIAGTKLDGVVESQKVLDFGFVKEVDTCILEVRPADPHSVRVSCWPVGEQLYIGCKDCEGKTWSSIIQETPFARVKIGEKLFPVKATRIEDQFVERRAWQIRWGKYEKGDPEPIPEGYWLFHMASSAPDM